MIFSNLFLLLALHVLVVLTWLEASLGGFLRVLRCRSEALATPPLLCRCLPAALRWSAANKGCLHNQLDTLSSYVI